MDKLLNYEQCVGYKMAHGFDRETAEEKCRETFPESNTQFRREFASVSLFDSVKDENQLDAIVKQDVEDSFQRYQELKQAIDKEIDRRFSPRQSVGVKDHASEEWKLAGLSNKELIDKRAMTERVLDELAELASAKDKAARDPVAYIKKGPSPKDLSKYRTGEVTREEATRSQTGGRIQPIELPFVLHDPAGDQSRLGYGHFESFSALWSYVVRWVPDVKDMTSAQRERVKKDLVKGWNTYQDYIKGKPLKQPIGTERSRGSKTRIPVESRSMRKESAKDRWQREQQDALKEAIGLCRRVGISKAQTDALVSQGVQPAQLIRIAQMHAIQTSNYQQDKKRRTGRG